MVQQVQWRNALVQEYGVHPDALQSLSGEQRKKLRIVVGKNLRHRSDLTQNEVLRLLEEYAIVSTLASLLRCRMGFLIHRERTDSLAAESALREERERREAECQQVLAAVNEKFTVLSCFKEQIDVVSKTVILGGGFIFRYSITHDNVDVTLEDTKTGHSFTIFSGDSPEKLGAAMQECYDKRAEWLRTQAAPPVPVDDQPPPPYEDSSIHTETDAPGGSDGKEMA